MASFEEIMNRPASEIKPPPALPVGTYHCLVDGIPQKGTSKTQKDFLTFKYKILAPLADVNAQAAAEAQVVGKVITHDYYVTDAAVWRLVDMLRDNLGIDDSNGKTPFEMVAEAPGKQILVKLKHDPSDDGKRVYHRVESTAAV